MKFRFITTFFLLCVNILSAQIYADHSLAAQALAFSGPPAPNVRIDLTAPVPGSPPEIKSSHGGNPFGSLIFGVGLSVVGVGVTLGSSYELVTASNGNIRQQAIGGILAGTVLTGLGGLILYSAASIKGTTTITVDNSRGCGRKDIEKRYAQLRTGTELNCNTHHN